nr:MAG TPA: hypothetical protein [Caudoviricetes sp.]
MLITIVNSIDIDDFIIKNDERGRYAIIWMFIKDKKCIDDDK